MGIRLNQAIRRLNIGLQTAVDFLNEKRSDLGKVEADTSFKLSDEQYKALEKAFQTDKSVKDKADEIFTRPKDKEKKISKEKRNDVESAPEKPRVRIKQVGKIDLDGGNKKTDAKVQSVKPAEKKTSAVSQNIPENKSVPSAAPEKRERVNENKTTATGVQTKDTTQTEKPVENKKQTIKSNKDDNRPKNVEAVATVTPNVENNDKKNDNEKKSGDDKLFTLKSEHRITPKVNILGKIDLDSLNQSTRPKKKSKEERKKEREEKQQVNNKGRRHRITKERVDINAAAGQNEANKHNANNNKKKRAKQQQPKPVETTDEDVARQVKETLARLTNKKTINKKGAKYRREKRDAVQQQMKERSAERKAESKILKLTEFVTVSELASMMNVNVNEVIGTCMSIGIMVSINQRLEAETINIVAEEFGFKTEYVSADVQEAIHEEEDDEEDLVSRGPIITVMGHVDHGKTSLLDYIRRANVIAGEAGGITQHIGAYHVTLDDGRSMTFLDTPGHEAFTAMRARGTQITDIAIIIISADDSVMPTTKEAIAHAQAANVPMVFAINKIDKPGANPDKIRQDLAAMNLLVEEWGGKYQCQEISAKKGIGVQELLEKVLLEADMLELRANPNRKATGSIIESSLDKGRGYVSTVLVQNGTLKVGDVVIAGTSYGRVKALFNERNKNIDKVRPAEPTIILGLNGAPTAGDTFHVLETEQEAREIANKRLQLQREQGLRTQKRLTLSDISHRIALGSFKELNIIVKGDTDGSTEALSDSFIKMSTEKIKVNVIYKAVGQISESDVTLADASDAIIVGFQVRPSAAARKQADGAGVEINTYSVIYDAIDDVHAAMEGMLDKVKKEVVTGQVEVREVFHISKVGTVAGAYVTEGKVHRSDKARLVRDGIVIHSGDIDSLKRYKDDVKEVAANFECGISLVNFNDILAGDIIETFMEVEVKQKL